MDNSPSGARILIVGASGVTGAAQTKYLIEFGHPVRLITRHTDKLRAHFSTGVEIVRADVTNPSSLTAALEGCQGLHISLNSPSGPRRFHRIEYDGVKNLVGAAEEAGVKQITYVSSANVTDDAELYVFQIKKQVEDLLLEQPIPAIVFRVSWLMEMLLFLVRGNRAFQIGRQRNLYRFIAAKDLARMVSFAHTQQSGFGLYYAYGPQALRLADALQTILDRRGGGKIVRVPLGVFAGLANILGGRAKFAYRTLRYLEQVPEPVHHGAAEEIFGRNTTTLAQWLDLLGGKPAPGSGVVDDQGDDEILDFPSARRR